MVFGWRWYDKLKRSTDGSHILFRSPSFAFESDFDFDLRAKDGLRE